jgi:transposase-like protein
MKPKNKYHRRSRISEAKFREFLRYFALDLEARKIVRLTGLSKNTVHRYFQLLRRSIAAACERESPYSGEVEVDESYFGPRRVKGKRGRGAGGKTIVFGIFKRNGHVYTEIVPDAKKKTLPNVIRGNMALDSVIHSDTWRGYDGLVDFGYKNHFRVRHGQSEFVKGKSHINGIENFWGLAKVRLVRFRGMHKHTFYLHLKECEFRFNHRKENLYQVLLGLLRKHPLNWE